MRDPDSAAVFIREFDEYEKNFDSPDPDKRLPNYMVMSPAGNHTRGAAPGEYTPIAISAGQPGRRGRMRTRQASSDAGRSRFPYALLPA